MDLAANRIRVLPLPPLRFPGRGSQPYQLNATQSHQIGSHRPLLSIFALSSSPQNDFDHKPLWSSRERRARAENAWDGSMHVRLRLLVVVPLLPTKYSSMPSYHLM